MELTLNGEVTMNLCDGNAQLWISENSVRILLRGHGRKGTAPKVRIDWHTGEDVKGVEVIPESSRSNNLMKGYALKFPK